jgi:hypothetical protein
MAFVQIAGTTTQSSRSDFQEIRVLSFSSNPLSEMGDASSCQLNDSFDSVITDSEQIARVWTENPTFTLGEVTLASLQSKIASLRQKRDQVESLRTQLTALTNQLNEQTSEMASVVTRARSGFRAVYSPDSSQYEQAGGTRSSERKRPSFRKSSPTS